jgi:hypothetical protein
MGKDPKHFITSEPGLIFPSLWNVRQKAAVATLRVLCGLTYCPRAGHPWYILLSGECILQADRILCPTQYM